MRIDTNKKGLGGRREGGFHEAQRAGGRVSEPKPIIGLEGRAEPQASHFPAAGYAGRTRYTQLEYEALLANASIGIAFTRERRFFLCNPRFAELFGYRPEELIG